MIKSRFIPKFTQVADNLHFLIHALQQSVGLVSVSILLIDFAFAVIVIVLLYDGDGLMQTKMNCNKFYPSIRVWVEEMVCWGICHLRRRISTASSFC
jgi:hypothetical protein